MVIATHAILIGTLFTPSLNKTSLVLITLLIESLTPFIDWD